MKNALFLCFVTLVALQQTKAQSAPPQNGEARDLVASIRESATEVDSTISNLTSLRNSAQRQNKREEAQFLDNTLKLMVEMKGFGDRVLRAGENMTAASLNSFKTEAARLDKKLETVLGSKPADPSATSFLGCVERCHGYFPHWWQFLKRGLCMTHCLLFG